MTDIEKAIIIDAITKDDLIERLKKIYKSHKIDIKQIEKLEECVNKIKVNKITI